MLQVPVKDAEKYPSEAMIVAQSIMVWPVKTENAGTVGQHGFLKDNFTPKGWEFIVQSQSQSERQYNVVGNEKKRAKVIAPAKLGSEVNKILNNNPLSPADADARLDLMTSNQPASDAGDAGVAPVAAGDAGADPVAEETSSADEEDGFSDDGEHVSHETDCLNKHDLFNHLKGQLQKNRGVIDPSNPASVQPKNQPQRRKRLDENPEMKARMEALLTSGSPLFQGDGGVAAAKPSKGWVDFAGDVAKVVGNALGAKSFEPEDAEKKKVIAQKQKAVQQLVKDNTELRKERGLGSCPPPPPPLEKETQDEKIAHLDKMIKDLTEENQDLQKRPKITTPPPPAAAAARPASPAMAPAMAAGAGVLAAASATPALSAMAPAMAAGAGVAPVAGGVGVVDPMDLQLLRERVQDLENELRDKNQYIRLREMDHNAAISIKDGALQSADVRQKFLENQVQDLTTQLQALQVQVTSKDAQIQALQAPQPANVLETHRLRQQVAQQQADLAKANADIANLQAQLALPPPPSAEEARLQAELTLAKNEVAMLRAHPPSAPPLPASTEVARLQAEIARLRAHPPSAPPLPASTEVARLQAEIARLKATPAAAAPVDVENTPLYKDLLAAFEQVSQEALDYQAKVHKLEMEMRALQKSPGVPLSVSHDKQCAKLQDTIDDLNDKMTKLSLEKKILQQKVTELTNDKSDQTSVSESREERIRGLKAENARLAADYKELNKTYHALLKKHGERLGGLPKEVEQMYEQYKAAKSGPPPERFRRY